MNLYNILISHIYIYLSYTFKIPGPCVFIKNVAYYTFNIPWRYIPYYKPLIYHLIDLGHTTPLTYLLFSQSLDSRSFPQNLESWIQGTLQSLQAFWDSRFWEKLLESKTRQVSPKILNLESRKVCKVAKFWEVHMPVYMYTCVFKYIYIYGPPF